jgi:ferritin-like metal-binding protein YciE
MKTLDDLFKEQLKNLFCAENQLLLVLPKMIDYADNKELKKALESHFEQTKIHKSRIETIFKELNIAPKGDTCVIMKGLIKEVLDYMEDIWEKNVSDVGIIAHTQSIKYYEISGYLGTIRYARELEHKDIANKLQETLNEEFEANDDLSNLAEERLNRLTLQNINKIKNDITQRQNL